MSLKLVTNLDFNQNQALNFVVQQLASDPGSPVEGEIWYRSDLHTIREYSSGTTKTIATLTNSLSDFSVPTGNLSAGGFQINNMANGTASTDAATVGQLNNAILGLDIHASVRVASTGSNINVASALVTGFVIDGYTCALGDRVLIKDNTAGSDNGIYVVVASGAAPRASDCNTATNYLQGAFCFVEKGTANGGASFVTSTAGPYVIGTTSISWVTFAGAGVTYGAGSGLTLTGTVFSVNVTGNSIEISSGNLRVKSNATTGQALLSAGTGVEAGYGAINLAGGSSIVTGTLPLGNGGGYTSTATAKTTLGFTTKYAQAVGNASLTSFTVNHALGSSNVDVTVVEVATGDLVMADILVVDANNITVNFATAPASNAFEVVVVA
jgi:hypothetical protein